jgi:hypothetical protein
MPALAPKKGLGSTPPPVSRCRTPTPMIRAIHCPRRERAVPYRRSQGLAGLARHSADLDAAEAARGGRCCGGSDGLGSSGGSPGVIHECQFFGDG